MVLVPGKLKPGHEQHEEFTSNKKRYVQYGYRHVDGELFSCVKPTLEECQTARDKWLNR